MHVFIVCLYGWVIWFSAMAYALIAGRHFWIISACGPFIICGAMAMIWALEYAVCKLHTLATKAGHERCLFGSYHSLCEDWILPQKEPTSVSQWTKGSPFGRTKENGTPGRS